MRSGIGAHRLALVGVVWRMSPAGLSTSLRLYQTRAPDHSTSSSASTSATSAASTPTARRRVTRRTNYADLEALAEDARRVNAAEAPLADKAADTIAHAAQQHEAQLRAAQRTTLAVGQLPPDTTSSVSSSSSSSSMLMASPSSLTLRARWSAGRERVLLELLQTRRLGVSWGVSLWLRYVMAYAAYVGLGGHIEFYTRRSIAPPPTGASASLAEVEDVSSAAVDDLARVSLGGVANGEAGVSPGLVRASRGLLKDRAHPSVFIGSSPIHSRGLFTSEKLPRGTRVLTEPQRSFLLTPSFLRLLADTHEKLPETWHYTHPSGALPELVLQAQPHHLLNHSCEPNLVSGLSPVFWEAAAASGRADVMTRLASWDAFADPNSFFLTRDVEAGEELTVDYSVRVAPMSAAATSAMATGAFLHVCRCGAPSCRQFVYRPRPALQAYLHGGGGGGGGQAGEAAATRSCFEVARDLIGLGVDDETILLSLLPSRAPLVAYVHSWPMPELAAPGTLKAPVVAVAPDMQARRFAKGDIILCYRHVFRDLNEAAPQDAVPK